MDIFPNGTVVFQWCLFMTALIALHYGVFRPVLHLLRVRRERTEGERIKAEQLTRRAEELLAEIEGRLREAREKGMEAREARIREGETREHEILRKVRSELDQKMELLRKDLEREGREVSLKLRQYAQELSHDIAERLLERSV